jgi:ribosomal protein L37E
MSDLVQGAQQDYWRPPVNAGSSSGMAEACRRCGTEFMVGAAFCHICGMGRHRSAPKLSNDWTRHFQLLRTLEFSNVKRWFGLPLAPLCAFLLGTAFLLVAVIVGLLNSEFEVIQFWRIQWLMAACAAYLAGILLKNRQSEN